MKKESLTFSQLLNAVADHSMSDVTEQIREIALHFDSTPQQPLWQKPYAGIYVRDYTANRYLYANEYFARMSGVPLSRVIKDGVRNSERKTYQPDMAIHHNQVFRDVMGFFANVPPQAHPRYRMSSNYRIFNGNGALVSILQESHFIKSAPDGKPLLVLGAITNITHLNMGDRIGSAIYDDAGTLRHRHDYYSTTGNEALTPRQVTVLKLACDGKKNEEIATIMNITVKRVEQHRQNIRVVTNCSNLAEMIRYAIARGYVI